MNIDTAIGYSKKLSLFLFAAGLAFSLAIANIGWVLLSVTICAEYLTGRRKFAWVPSGLELPLAAGVVLYVVSSVAGVAPVHSLMQLPSAMIFVVLYVCRYGFAKDDAVTALKIFAAVTGIAALFGLLQYAVGIDVDLSGELHRIPAWMRSLPEPFLKEMALKQGRLMSTRSHPITYAECAFFGFLFIITFFLIERDRFKKFLWAGAGAVTLAAIIFSYSRGAWLALAAGFPILMIVKKKKIIRVRYVTAVVLVISAFIFAHPALRTRFLSLDIGSRGSNQVRYILWKTGREIIRDNPVTGVGPGTLGFVYEKYRREEILDKRTWTELHNQYIQYAVEQGILGLGVFLWLIISIGVIMFRSWKSDIWQVGGQLTAAGLACLTGLVVMSLTENAFFDSEVALILWFIIGTTVAGDRPRRVRPDIYI